MNTTPPTILANAEIRDEFMVEGVAALRNGASAADVAELVARRVEDDPDEHSVGYSGYPNILGEVELDASFMDGRTLQAGAVGALKGFRHPISVARQLAERLPHVLLVGPGAARFAAEIGAEQRDMLTDFARDAWHDKLKAAGVPVDQAARLGSAPGLINVVRKALGSDREIAHDTMNVIVRDATGHIVSAVTTSGIAWKYPGRLGDSPVIGAGNYADDRYGAAAAMGLGEISMRLSSCAHAIIAMRHGRTLEQAGTEVVRDMLPILGPSTVANHMDRADWIRLLIMDKHGRAGGFATRPGLQFKTQTLTEDSPRLIDCVTVV